MYTPSAISERLAMGTLEGFRHREFVEGTDDDYVTSDLTSADCSFNRFAEVSRLLWRCFGRLLWRLLCFAFALRRPFALAVW